MHQSLLTLWHYTHTLHNPGGFYIPSPPLAPPTLLLSPRMHGTVKRIAWQDNALVERISHTLFWVFRSSDQKCVCVYRSVKPRRLINQLNMSIPVCTGEGAACTSAS